MAATLVQSATSQGSGVTSNGTTLSSAVTAGNLLVIFMYATGNGTADFFGPAGFTKAGEGTSGTAGVCQWWKIADGTEGTTFTCTTTNAGFIQTRVMEWANDVAWPTSPVDAQGGSSSSSAATLTTSATSATTKNECLAIAGVATSGTVVWSNSWTGGFASAGLSGARHNIATKQTVATEVLSTTETWDTARVPRGTLVAYALSDAVAPPTPTLTGRWVGAVDTTSATVTTKTTNTSSVRIKVATDAALTTGVLFGAAAVPDAQGVAKPTITGLAANTLYYYGIELDGSMDAAVGQFRTFPSGAASFSFAFGSCTNDTDSDAFSRIAARDPLLFLNVGDLRYYNPASNDQSIFQAMYDEVLAAPNESDLYANVPTVYTWSDHDFGGSNSDGSDPAKPAAQAVYRQYVPHYPLSDAEAIYQAFTVGRVRFIVTDNRSYKSDKDAVDDASKTMLGATQKQWFKDEITNATELLIVWANENPWNCDATEPDTWGGYTTERSELAAHIAASGKQVLIVSGDMHALAADDGTNSAGGIPICQGAPLNNFTNTKPGTYSQGTYAGAGKERYYGWVDVTDDGTTITADFTGYNTSDLAQVTLTVTASPPGSTLDLLRLGAGTVDLAYGGSPVDAAYIGATQVWP